MTALTDIIALVRRYKNIVLTAAFVIALFFGSVYVKHWYNEQLMVHYNSGVMDTDAKWEKVMQQNKADQAKFKADQQEKVDKLAAENALLKSQHDALKQSNDNRQNNYAQSTWGRKQGLDDEAVAIYNESLGIR